jgi:hypothetical protein
MKVSFKKRYFIPFLLVLVAEIAIAVFHFHRFVRGFLGDILAIPLLYYLLRAFASISHKRALILVLATAFVIEGLQWINFAEISGITSGFWLILLGNTFDWKDLIAYGLGGLIIHLIHKITFK